LATLAPFGCHKINGDSHSTQPVWKEPAFSGTTMPFELLIGAAVGAAVASQRVRKVVRKGLVYGLAGALVAYDKAAGFATEVRASRKQSDEPAAAKPAAPGGEPATAQPAAPAQSAPDRVPAAANE
jgi:hypothetical protein